MDSARNTHFEPEQPHHATAIDALLDDVFGDNRNGRAVYRLRDGRPPDIRLSWVGIDAYHEVVASIRYWPIWIDNMQQVITQSQSESQPAVLLGPIAVRQRYQKHGLGEQLIRQTLELAAEYYKTVILVGPLDYYGRFGFVVDPHLKILNLEAKKTILRLTIYKHANA